MAGQPSSRALAVLVVVANLVLCAGVAAVLSAARDAAPPGVVTPGAITLPGPGGFVEVTGPDGMTTRLPAGWPVRRSPAPGAMRADDPAGTGAVLRYGGWLTPATDTFDTHVAEAREFASGGRAYAPVRLERTLVRGRPAVDWEFEYDAEGGRRHARAVYWLANGHEYFVQASSPVSDWARVRKVLEVMLTYSTP